jgi:hypothetical protein
MSHAWINALKICELEELSRRLGTKIKEKEKSRVTGLLVSKTDRLRKAIGNTLKSHPLTNEYYKREYENGKLRIEPTYKVDQEREKTHESSRKNIEVIIEEYCRGPEFEDKENGEKNIEHQYQNIRQHPWTPIRPQKLPLEFPKIRELESLNEEESIAYESEFAKEIKEANKKSKIEENYNPDSRKIKTSTPNKRECPHIGLELYSQKNPEMEKPINKQEEINKILRQLNELQVKENFVQQMPTQGGTVEHRREYYNRVPTERKIDLRMIPKFGGRDTENIQELFQLIELSAELGNYDEKEKLCLLINALEEKALKFLMELRRGNTMGNWETIKQCFLRKFKKPDAVLILEITTGKQKDNETGYEYYERIMEIRDQLEKPFDEETLVQCLKIGIKDHLKDKLALHDCSTLEKLKKALEKLEQLEEIKKECAIQKTKDLEKKIAELQVEALINKLEKEKKEEEKNSEKVNMMRSNGRENRQERYQYGRYHYPPEEYQNGYSRRNYRGRYEERSPPRYRSERNNRDRNERDHRRDYNRRPPPLRRNYDREEKPRRGNENQGWSRGRYERKKCENCPHLSNHTTRECYWNTLPQQDERGSKNE